MTDVNLNYVSWTTANVAWTILINTHHPFIVKDKPGLVFLFKELRFDAMVDKIAKEALTENDSVEAALNTDIKSYIDNIQISLSVFDRSGFVKFINVPKSQFIEWKVALMGLDYSSVIAEGSLYYRSFDKMFNTEPDKIPEELVKKMNDPSQVHEDLKKFVEPQEDLGETVRNLVHAYLREFRNTHDIIIKSKLD